jgi:hypothetical protein
MHTAKCPGDNNNNAIHRTANSTKTMLRTTISKKHKNEIMIAKDLINKNV